MQCGAKYLTQFASKATTNLTLRLSLCFTKDSQHICLTEDMGDWVVGR